MGDRDAIAAPSRREVLGLVAAAAPVLLPVPARSQPAVTPAPRQAEPQLRLLVAAPGRVRLRPSPARDTELWLLDDRTPGPVLRIRHGEMLRLRLENRTEKPLSLHWHGVRGDASADGVGGFGTAPVAPGATGDIVLTPPDPGTFLYRPLVLGGSSEPAARGLSGLLIVDEREPPAVDRDIPAVIGDWLLGDDNALLPFAPQPPEAAAAGRLGSWLTCNGKAPPERIALPPGARVRLRLANAANARIMRLRFDGMKAYVVAVDGQPTDSFEPVRAQLPFAPGTRYDVIFDMPEEAGASAGVTAMVGPGVPLLRFVAEGSRKAGAVPPAAALPPNPRLPAEVKLQNAHRAALLIEGGAAVTPEFKLDLAGVDLARPWRINGAAGGDAAGRPLFSVRRGTPVVIAIENRTAFIQPLHVHGHSFRLLHPLDDGWEPYFLDTVQIPEGRKLHIAFIADNPGRWPISSSVLERFDAGLWSWFEVT